MYHSPGRPNSAPTLKMLQKLKRNRRGEYEQLVANNAKHARIIAEHVMKTIASSLLENTLKRNLIKRVPFPEHEQVPEQSSQSEDPGNDNKQNLSSGQCGQEGQSKGQSTNNQERAKVRTARKLFRNDAAVHYACSFPRGWDSTL